MRTILAIVSALTMLAATVTAASANGGVRVGVLTCSLDGGVGYIIASRKTMTCTYRGNGSAPETYRGTTTKIGLDAGATAEGILSWGVFAPTSNLGASALEGRYFGVGAEATFGLGVGANILVGGSDRSINLIPISLQGQLGANVAAGLESLRLTYVR